MDRKHHVMCLNKNGNITGNLITPDFKRDDIKKFIHECEANSVSEDTGKAFIIAIYNAITWEHEPELPSLSEEHYKLWELDEYEISEIFKFIKANFSISLSWEHEKIPTFLTFKDILQYLENEINKI